MRVKIFFISIIIIIVFMLISVFKSDNKVVITYKNTTFSNSFIKNYISIKSYENTLQSGENRILSYNDVENELIKLIIVVELAYKEEILLDNDDINKIEGIVNKLFNKSLSGFSNYCNKNNLEINKDDMIDYYKYIYLSEKIYTVDKDSYYESKVNKAIEVTKIIIAFDDDKNKSLMKANNILKDLKASEPLLEVVSRYGVSGIPNVLTDKNIGDDIKYLLDEKTGYISEILEDSIENSFVIYRINEESNDNLINRVIDINNENYNRNELNKYIESEIKNVNITKNN